MSNVYIDERLLDAAGLSDFPELYAYIKGRYSKPLGQLPQPVPIGDQTLQYQVKNIDDIIYASNEEFELPVPNAITKLDLSSQLERQSFLASSGSDPQLIVYDDRITLTVSYSTTCLFRSGDIIDTWNVNGKGQFEAQSYVQEIVKKQADLIEAGVQGLNRTNYLNSEIKIMDELALYKANRAAYFIKDGSFITYSFGAKLVQLDANYEAQQIVYKLFSTISIKLLPPNTKYMPIHVEQQEFSAMYLFKDMYDKSSAVQVAVSRQFDMLDCEFQGTYILDNYANSTNIKEAAPEDVESHIAEIIVKHEKQLSSSPQPQYTITNVYNQFMIIDFFPSSAYNTFYIGDDGTCRVCVFNLYFESKGLNGRTQEVGHISNSILSADGKSLGFPAAVYRSQGGRQNNFSVNYFIADSQFKMLQFQLSEPQESIPMDSSDVYKYCASGMYYL
ncbi:MAG: hypothetical protein EZS28_006922 [Streblomastix strix]|uniref:Uncharacterized protein n=1 Tax=Streblomastix strix TaxID=222440 RepID=A0A5J4WRX0_9EUKA|nr:MAG: hypothetical protein EZS28_006922 [Streblomastix strix]